MMPLTDLLLKTELAVSKEQWKGHWKQNANSRGCEDHTQMISACGCQLWGRWGQAELRALETTSGRRNRPEFEVRVFVWVQILILLSESWMDSGQLALELHPLIHKVGLAMPKSQVFPNI